MEKAENVPGTPDSVSERQTRTTIAEDLAALALKTAGDTEAGIISPPHGPRQPACLEDMAREGVIATLRSTNWNKSQAAGILGIERSTLDRKIRRYDLTELKPTRVPCIE